MRHLPYNAKTGHPARDALSVSFSTRSRGNPFLRAVARQKFLPPGSLALSRFSLRDLRPCENRSAAPAAPSLFRPQDALGAAAPWGQNLALNRALGLVASHTLSAKFPCMCPVHPHMSAGQDFFSAGLRRPSRRGSAITGWSAYCTASSAGYPLWTDAGSFQTRAFLFAGSWRTGPWWRWASAGGWKCRMPAPT